MGITAQVDGVHKLVLDFLSVQIMIEKEFSFGEAIEFPVSLLNENFTYKGQLFDPTGKLIIIEKDDIQYDCIRFRTTITIAA